MIRIAAEPWEVMVAHARRAYPNECCGAMLGSAADGVKDVREALPLKNAFTGEQDERYELRPEDLLAADRAARERGMELIGIYHSHPDCDAYFSETDLKNSCPWYSFLVLSIRYGFYHHANSWLPDMELTGAVKEKLIVERAAASSPPRFVVVGQTAADR
jgi:proteasome lid subunit RPN8/RPN11